MNIDKTLAEIDRLYTSANAEYVSACLVLTFHTPGTSEYDRAVVDVVNAALGLGEITGYREVLLMMKERKSMLN